MIGPVPDDMIHYLGSGNTSEVSEAAVSKALSQLPDRRQIAVLSFNDDAAYGTLQAARKLDHCRQYFPANGRRVLGSTDKNGSPKKKSPPEVILAGRSNRGIGDEIYLSVNTIRWYASQIFIKLGTKTGAKR